MAAHPGRGNIGSSHLLEARLDTQTLDLAPAPVQEPLMDPAGLDLEASTLSRSFHRPKSDTKVDEGVLVSIEAEPPGEASKLSQVLYLFIDVLNSGTVNGILQCGLGGQKLSNGEKKDLLSKMRT